jgi:short-subunit dehydrogenase
MTELSMDDWRYVFEVNFFAALNLSYAVLPLFLEQGRGKIVNIASVAGKIAFPGSVCYSASKFALTGLSEGMAAEFAGKVDVLTVCPGWVRTDFFKRNNTSDDPTAIADEPGMRGWMMKNILSISSEQASRDILKALYRGGSQELVLTIPGFMAERMSGLFPELTFFLTSLVPADRGRRKK